MATIVAFILRRISVPRGLYQLFEIIFVFLLYMNALSDQIKCKKRAMKGYHAQPTDHQSFCQPEQQLRPHRPFHEIPTALIVVNDEEDEQNPDLPGVG